MNLKEYILEGKMKQLASDLDDMDNGNFVKKYGKDKERVKLGLRFPKKVNEEVLSQADKIKKINALVRRQRANNTKKINKAVLPGNKD